MKYLNLTTKKIERNYDNYTVVNYATIDSSIYSLRLPQYKEYFYNIFNSRGIPTTEACLFHFHFEEENDLNEFLLATLLRYFVDFLCENGEKFEEKRLGAPVELEEKVFLNHNKLVQIFNYKPETLKSNKFNITVGLGNGEIYEMVEH
jgi:hypothetical protein